MSSISQIDDHLAVAERKPAEDLWDDYSANRWPLAFGAACWFLASAFCWAAVAWLLSL